MKSWQEFISHEMEQDYFKELSRFLAAEAKEHTIVPAKKDIFAAFNLCPLERVKIVILGQDPYPSSRYPEAHGLAFSVPDDIPHPPSLHNIFEEIRNDLGIKNQWSSGDLAMWAHQGVFLLNSILTTRKGEIAAHKGQGWQIFTDNAIKLLNEQNRPMVAMLWGNFAKTKKELLTNKKILVLEAAHPSPLSAHKGFFGCKHFSRANEYLFANGIKPVNWTYEPPRA